MIYLDNNATTRPATRVVDAMLGYLGECYFNASSAAAAFTGVEEPRRQAASAMARLLKAEEPECFTFTSGATESNNWSVVSAARRRGRGRILISTIEHPSIAEPAAGLGKGGYEVVEIPVSGDGWVRLDELKAALNEDTILVSVQAANNETGVLQPMAEIGRLVRECSQSALFHTDATQAVGKIQVDLQREWQEVDLLSFSAHKFLGPKGIGGLYARPGLELPPFMLGGGQEGGRRSGTTNTPALAGLAVAAELALAGDVVGISNLRDVFEVNLLRRFPNAVVHGAGAARLPNTSCFSIPGLVANEVAEVLATKGIIIGTGSACSSGALHPPKTLLAMGVNYDTARAALRLSLSASNSSEDIEALLTQLQFVTRKI